jgi:hypothetical protein
MNRLLARLFGIFNRGTKSRWDREEKARRLGLFEASPSQVVNGVAQIGVRAIDRMRSGNLGSPDSQYYEDQDPDQFDKAYKKIQKKTESLLAHRE